jgi:hypothetical protein
LFCPFGRRWRVQGQGTFPFGINSQGTITGYYVDNNGVSHGFLRTPTGTTSTIHAPNAGTSGGQGTVSYGMNQAGTLAGYYVDNNNVYHGVLVTGE